ncbi:MAG: hypothetical protein ABI220_04045 [Candidatus Saccharimonadales bacterium]
MHLKIKNQLWRRILAGLVLLALLAVPVIVNAQTVTQGYTADGDIKNGMIVRLEGKNGVKAQALKSDEAKQMHGVAVAADDSAITLSGDGATNQIYVATTGKYDVLVSTQNGGIKTGDWITISSIAGIGMKVGDSQPVVLGKALGNFNGTSNVSSVVDVSDTAGHSQKVSVGMVGVDIGVGHNPYLASNMTNVPAFLAKAGEAIANKSISTARLYVSLAVLVLTVVIVAIFLYGGVRSGIISIGRNPLAKASIARGLIQVALTGLIIFIVGLFAVYLILKL